MIELINLQVKMEKKKYFREDNSLNYVLVEILRLFTWAR
jgi:hypothetical protein